jgi:HEAT repeat protein
MDGSKLAALAVACWGLVLVGCVTPPPSGPPSPQAQIDARQTLLSAADDPDAVTRMNAMEALAGTVGADACSIYMQGMADPLPAVRFAGAMAAGDACCGQAEKRLKEMAVKGGNGERNKMVFVAVVYALHKLGNDTYTGELGQMLFDKEPEIRAQVALVMGKMDIPSATVPLGRLRLMEQNEMVRIQIDDSLAMLGDEAAAMRLEGAAKLPSDSQMVAIEALGRQAAKGGIGAWRATRVLQNLTTADNPPRVRVAAAGALARGGEVDDDVYRYTVAAASSPEATLRAAVGQDRKLRPVEIKSVQRLAAIALGHMKQRPSLSVLHSLLSDSDAGVRVAAAMSILRLVGPGESRLAAPAVRPLTPVAPPPAAAVAIPDSSPPEPPPAATMPLGQPAAAAMTVPAAQTKPAPPPVMTMPAAETKPAVETKPIEAKPVVVETKPVVVQTKPAAVEAKPVVVETKPVVVQTKPAVEAKPVVVETKPAVVQTKPAAVEAKPQPAQSPAASVPPAAAATRPAPAPQTIPATATTRPAAAAVAPPAPQSQPATDDLLSPLPAPAGGVRTLKTAGPRD